MCAKSGIRFGAHSQLPDPDALAPGCQAAGLSRAGLARRAGVPASTLRNWKADRGFPGPAAGLRLAGALGVTPERLAEGVEDTAEDEALAAGEEARRRRKGKTP
jgi:transcriptional regulator with XRE-family HTH domain